MRNIRGKQELLEVNFDSPRTQRAASILGITINDCIKKPQKNFLFPELDQRIAQLTYDHHCDQVQRNIKDLYEVRQRLIKREQENAVVEKKEHDLLRKQTLPGHFPNPVEKLLNSGTSVDLNTIMSHAERAELMEYMKRSWKEVNMVLDDERRALLIQDRKAKAKKGSQTLPISQFHSVCEEKNKGQNNASENSSFEFNKQGTETKNKNSSSKSLLPHVNDRSQVLKRLDERKSLEQEKEEKNEKEWQEYEVYFKNLRNKCNTHT